MAVKAIKTNKALGKKNGTKNQPREKKEYPKGELLLQLNTAYRRTFDEGTPKETTRTQSWSGIVVVITNGTRVPHLVKHTHYKNADGTESSKIQTVEPSGQFLEVMQKLDAAGALNRVNVGALLIAGMESKGIPGWPSGTISERAEDNGPICWKFAGEGLFALSHLADGTKLSDSETAARVLLPMLAKNEVPEILDPTGETLSALADLF